MVVLHMSIQRRKWQNFCGRLHRFAMSATWLIKESTSRTSLKYQGLRQYFIGEFVSCCRILGYSSAGRALEWHSREVSGSIPLISTKTTNHKAKIRLCGLCYRKGKRGIGYLDEKTLEGGEAAGAGVLCELTKAEPR